MRDLHVTLPEVLYERLHELSRTLGRPATTIVREAIEQWVRQIERRRISEEIAVYAAACARSDQDLDEELERAASEPFFRE